MLCHTLPLVVKKPPGSYQCLLKLSIMIYIIEAKQEAPQPYPLYDLALYRKLHLLLSASHRFII